LFLENIRFYPGEEKNDAKFSKLLSSFGDVFVERSFFGRAPQGGLDVWTRRTFAPLRRHFIHEEIQALRKVLQQVHKPLVV